MRARTGAIGRSLALALAIACLVLLVVPTSPAMHEGIWEAVGDAVHFPLMAGFTLLLFASRLTGRGKRPLGCAGTALIAATTVVAMEVVQPLFGRNASIGDTLHGLLGVAAAVGGHYAWRSGGALLRLLHGIVTTGLLVTMLHPAWIEWRAILWRSRSFPVLGAFEDEIELRLWRDRSPAEQWPTTLRLSSEHVQAGRLGLAVRTGAGSWPGVIYHAGGEDWSGYSRLAWEIYNPAEPFRLALRIDDEVPARHESSFHRTLTVGPGWNRFDLATDTIRRGPRARELDLARVQRLYLYAEGDRPRLFFLDHVRLE